MSVQEAFSFTTAPAPPTRRNVVIEAGAGTGKTTAIVAEVLKLMLGDAKLDPERIVLMTFTEKAAGEIADRVRGALEELANRLSVVGDRLSESPRVDEGVPAGAPEGTPLPANRITWPPGSPNPLVVIDDVEKARSAIAHHLANIDTLRSQTIHSFCQSILRSFPIEAGLDPQFKIVEGFERSLLYGQLYDAWLDEETRVHPTPEAVREWELLFEHAGYLFLVRDLVLMLSNRRDLLNETEYDFGDFEADVVPSLTAAVLWIRTHTDECKDNAAMAVATYLRSTPFDGGTFEQWLDYLQPIASALREIKLPGCGKLKEPMSVLRAGGPGESAYDLLVAHRSAMALVALTRRFLAYLDEEKRKLGVVDFDDLLLRTLAVLDDPQVLARARSQFDFIFVDEFQDTDRTQAAIIDRLARGANGEYVAGKTIVVGDPKQSIYGFRRADPETYYRMTEKLTAGGAERRIILDQYRSDPPLLETINATFERIFPPTLHDPNVFRPPYHSLRAARGESRLELDARFTLLHAQAATKADRHFAEATAIAEWIESRRDGSPTDLQRFAILFRRLTILDDYLETFRRYGIDYVLPPTRSFLDRRAPVDLLAVLRALAYPFDLGAQISAARSPYFALTDEEIVSAVGAGRVAVSGDDEGSGTPAAGPWQQFTDAMASLRSHARHLTVSQLMDFLIDDRGIEAVYRVSVEGERDLAHLERVRAIAFDYDQRTGGSLQHFVDEISRRRAEPEEMEPSLIDESQNAVRIMSVHAAKGLEFETVILPDLSFATSGSESLQFFTVEEPRSLVLAGRAQSISGNFRKIADEPLRKIAKQRDDAEALRLFYVAVTRAKTDVVFVVNPEDNKAGFRKALASVVPDISFGEEAGREVRMTEIGPVAFERMAASERSTRSRSRLRDAALETSLSGEIVEWKDLPSTPVAQSLAAAEIAARRTGSQNRLAGILLHRVLELWDGAEDATRLLSRLATEAAADGESVERVRRRLQTMARSETMQRIARAETVGRELPLRFLEDGVLVERRVDRLIREEGREIVIDYKSGAAEPSRVAKDSTQVARYAAAVSAITGRPCEGLLWYVDLDRDEVVRVEGSSRR